MAYPDTEQTIEISQVWGVLILRWRLITVFLLLGVALAGIQQIARSPEPEPVAAVVSPDPISYKASATYMAVAMSADGLPADEALRVAQSMAATYRTIMTGPTVMNSLAAVTGHEIQAGADGYTVDIGVAPGTALIGVNVSAGSAQSATDLANGLVIAMSAVPGFDVLNIGAISTRLDLVDPASRATPVFPLALVPVQSHSINPFVLFVPIAMFLGVVAAFVVEWVDGRANWPRQVEGETGMVVIGRLEHRRRKVDPISMFLTDNSGGVEAFREAKARLKAGLAGITGGRSVLVTSAGSGDGKTTVVANLSDALAEDGSNVIVVSSDLRSVGSIEMYWGQEGSGPGLSDYLLNPDVTVDDIVEPTNRAGVSLIRRGNSPQAALAMVDSDRMKNLIQELSHRADWALFDTPATLRVADAQRLAALVDGTLLIVDGVHSTISAVKAATAQLSEAGANLVGFFHNQYRGNPITSLLRH
ncbi:MAG: hypothetical protein O3B84_02955 [Chloroflexi bacterium]|nr:hypothetical protein [Chloroflexota bacterium]